MKSQISVDYLSHPWNSSDLHLAYSRNTNELTRVRQALQGLAFRDTVGRDQHRRLKSEQSRLVRYQNALWRQMSSQASDSLGKYNKRVDPSDLNWQKDSDITWLIGPLYCSKCESEMEFQNRYARSQGVHIPDGSCSTPGLKSALKTRSSFDQARSSLTKSLKSSPNLVRFDTQVKKITYQAEYPTNKRCTEFDGLSMLDEYGTLDDGSTLDIGNMIELISMVVHAFMTMITMPKAQTKIDHGGNDTRTQNVLIRYCRTLFSIIIVTASLSKSITLNSPYQYRQALKHRTRVSKRTIRFE
ncbi:hypothetical protein NQZ79_g3346 [Umbelopsis isabellina]|nr:hypothetical protein NQZ79_g3346 [Umbelopsis isabellina]